MGRSLLFALLLAGMTTAAQAQLWIGPAALEVRAEDGGKPAAGGEVRLEFLDMDPPAGPEPVRLDNKGRAVIGSLAEGRWRLEVSRPGAMTYRAEIELQRDGKPHLINAVQHNVPGAVSMMKVNLARAKGSSVPPPPREIAMKPRRPEPQPEIPAPTPPVEEVVPVTETPAPKPETPAPTPSSPPQQVPASAAEPLRPPPSLAPPTPAPTPRPEPRKETPPPVPTPVPERPAPAPAPTAPPVQPAAPPIQPPAPAPQRPMPTPAPERPAPAPAPVTPPTPPPTPATRQRSHEDRSCAECKPGESSLSVEVVAPPVAGASGCGDGLRDALLRRDGGAALPAGCQMLRLELPPNARYIGYKYEVQDGGASTDCLAGKDCPAGNARWPMDPLLFRDGTGKTTVSTAFENRSPDRERRAVLTVYFKEAGNPNAPRPMLPSRPRQPGRPPE